MKIFLNNKLYRIFLFSSVLGYTGRTLFDIAFIIYASKLSNPELAVSIVSIATTFPYMISFILGYFADRQLDKFNSIIRTRSYQFLLFVFFVVINIFDISWYIFIFIILINVLCDILGGYNSYLSISINTKIVEKQELSSALALQTSIYNSVSLGSKAIGVFILGVLSYNYSYFGMINASLFFISLVILYVNKNKFLDKIGKFDAVEVKKENKVTIKSFFKDTLSNLKTLKNIQSIYTFVNLFAGMNFYSSAMHALFLIIIVKTDDFIFGNIGYTIAFLEILEVVAVILGGIIQITFYKNMSLKNNVIIELVVFVLYILNILFIKDKILLVVLIFIIGYLAGISNPKLDALILQSVPENKQTSIYSIFGTIITITVPLGTFLIILITNLISINFSLYLLLILLLLLIFYAKLMKTNI